jgi:hypothetical protein
LTGYLQVSSPDTPLLPFDFELNEIIEFIRRKLAGENGKVRTIETDRVYRFTVYTVWSSRIVESRVVEIAESQKLYLFSSGSTDATNVNQFLVNETTCAWYVNAESGAVKYFKEPVEVSNKALATFYDLKVKRLDSRRSRS